MFSCILVTGVQECITVKKGASDQQKKKFSQLVLLRINTS